MWVPGSFIEGLIVSCTLRCKGQSGHTWCQLWNQNKSCTRAVKSLFRNHFRDVAFQKIKKLLLLSKNDLAFCSFEVSPSSMKPAATTLVTDFEKSAGFFSLLLKINYSYCINNAMVTRLVRVAGHSYLARHQSLLYYNSTICNLCQTGEETSWHLPKE